MTSSSWARFGVALLALAACSFVARPAEAARRRVVLVRPDATLAHAVSVALDSWDIDVESAQEESPGADLPRAQPRAEALARTFGADAVAWVEVSGSGAVLLVYDAGSKQLSSQVLDAPPPFDDARAAAVALSLKTVLRSSQVAPETERFGARPAPPPPPPPDVLRFEVLFGYRPVPDNVGEARGSIGVVYWPRFLGGHIGAGLDMGTGLGANVVGSAFNGTFEDVSYVASLRARMFLSSRLALEPAFRAVIHDTEIEGTLLTTGAPVELDYGDFGLGLSLTAEYRVGPLGLGVYAAGDRLLRYQDYVARGRLVLDGSPWNVEGGLRVSVGVF